MYRIWSCSLKCNIKFIYAWNILQRMILLPLFKLSLSKYLEWWLHHFPVIQGALWNNCAITMLPTNVLHFVDSRSEQTQKICTEVKSDHICNIYHSIPWFHTLILFNHTFRPKSTSKGIFSNNSIMQ